jgi:FAD:protein FMN transferase
VSGQGQAARRDRNATAAAPPRRRVLAILAGMAGLPLLFTGDAARDRAPLVRWRGTALGSPARIVLQHPDPGTTRRVLARCAAEIERIETVFSLYRPDSELVRLNADGRLSTPSHDLKMLLSRCQRLSELSDGAFDVSVQPLWNVYARHFFVRPPPSEGPDPKTIERALTLVDWRAIEVTSYRIVLGRPGMGLTLNGVAQGYLIDRIVDILRDHACERVFADMGSSEIGLVGSHPDGRPWRIGLADPRAPREIALTLDLVDRCVSTSGGYGTPFDATGRHHHLFDPRTGKSAGRHTAVTVIASRTMIADALSTALYVAQPERVTGLLAAFPDALAIVTAPDRSRQQLGGRSTGS